MEAWFPTVLVAAVAVMALAGALIAVVVLSSMRSPGRSRDEAATAALAWAARSKAALDAVPDWVLLVKDGVVIETNVPARSSLFEGASQRALGRVLEEIYPERSGILTDHLRRARESNRPLTFEFLYDGGQRYAEARIYPLEDGTALVVTRDETEQKAKEEVLHRGKERFALAVQGANDGLWDWDLETDELYFSYQWKTLVGYDPSEETNRAAHWFDRVHPEDLGGVRAALKAHVDGETTRFESEHRIRGADGTWRWVLTRGMAVRDSQGQGRRIAGSLTDLSNRRVVAVTQEKANLLQHATRSVGIGIAVLDGRGRLTGSADTLRAMTSEWRDLAEWWSSVVADYPAPDPVPCPICSQPHHVGTVLAEVDRPASGTFQPASIELLTRVFEIAWAGHAHEIGAADSHVLLVKDVTDRVRAERRLSRANEELLVARDSALAASRAKSAFLANMSHELRTPLNHILGYTELVAEELEDNGQSDLAADLGRVKSSGKHLLDMIAGILDLSRIEAGISTAIATTFPMEPLVDELLNQWRPVIEQRKNTIELHLEELGALTADRDQVRRILDALLSNAAKFCEGGQVTLTADTLYRSNREWLVLAVRDTGIGMAPEAVQGLFQAFEMAGDSGARREGGAGLGLTLANRFAEILGGAIDVSSRLGEGSTFRVILPRLPGPSIDNEDEEVTAEIRPRG